MKGSAALEDVEAGLELLRLDEGAGEKHLDQRGEVERMVGALMAAYPILDARWARRLIRAYETEAREILGDARRADDLGQGFGYDLTEAEVVWLMEREWAASAEDVLWRRSKLGLRLDAEQQAALTAWMDARRRAE